MKVEEGMGFCSILVDFENLFFSLLNYRPDLNAGQELVTVLDKLRYKIKEEYQLMPILNRSYADFQKNYEMADVQGDLQLAGFEPQFIHSKPSKNSADILLSIDAMEITVKRNDIRCIIICAGDSDYLPITRRILEYGKQVLLAGFSFSMSGDLKRQVGEDNILPLNSLLPRKPLFTANPYPNMEQGMDFGDPEDWKGDLEEDEQALTNLIVSEFRKHEREVWVGPFLRDIVPYVAELQHLSGFEVQDVIDHLKEKRVIGVRKVPGKPHPYSVFSINFAHPAVREILE